MSGTSLFWKTHALYLFRNSVPPHQTLGNWSFILCLPARAVKTQRVKGESVNENDGHLSTFWWYVTSDLLWCKNNFCLFVYFPSSCPVYQTEASRSSAFLHWRRRQWKSGRWLPRYSNRGPTPPPVPSPLWAEGSLWSWTGTDRRLS